jgi:hypothetical protein
MAYFCPHCKVYSTFDNRGPNVAVGGQLHAIWLCNACGGGVFALGDRITYPEVRSDAPEEYPEVVRENYAEALRSLNGNNPKAAVIMARSALQAATRQHGAKGANLNQEIEYLADNHIIPKALKDWAHELRDGGNLVGHPEPDKTIDMADAEELLALAESLFEYLYVIPQQLERRRARLSEALQQKEAAQ